MLFYGGASPFPAGDGGAEREKKKSPSPFPLDASPGKEKGSSLSTTTTGIVWMPYFTHEDGWEGGLVRFHNAVDERRSEFQQARNPMNSCMGSGG